MSSSSKEDRRRKQANKRLANERRENEKLAAEIELQRKEVTSLTQMARTLTEPSPAPATNDNSTAPATSTAGGEPTARADLPPTPSQVALASGGESAPPVQLDEGGWGEGDFMEAATQESEAQLAINRRDAASAAAAPAPAPVSTPAPRPVTNANEELLNAVDPFKPSTAFLGDAPGKINYRDQYFASRLYGTTPFISKMATAVNNNLQPAKGHKKFLPDPDALVKEADNKLIEPPPPIFDDALDTTMRRAVRGEAPGWQGMALKLGERRYQEAEGAIRDEYAEGFRAWLRGNCSNIDPNNGLSAVDHINRNTQRDLARQRAIYGYDPRRARFERLPGVSDYLDSFVDAQAAFERKIIQLLMRGPKDLDDAYLYYKYIVHGQKATPNDIMKWAAAASAGAQAVQRA
jgi:hypothetical protein